MLLDMKTICHALPPGRVSLGPGLFRDRFELNRAYLMRLRSEALLQSFYLEAAMDGPRQLRNTTHGDAHAGDDLHWGWETPFCQVRGHFLGHWLSAAARTYASTGDPALKLKADGIVAELGRCQEKNGGEWVGSIPEKYLHLTARGMAPWAPQYVLHKTFMGLHDMHVLAGNDQALDISDKFADWFVRWTASFSREAMDDILDVETGGMLEAWANLYALTGASKYAELIERYTRARLFDALLTGRDPLTNMHANTTIPEILGAARAYETTGEERWRRIVEAYWRCAVTDRGTFCTGGQTSGEIWTPPFEFAARLGDKNQEHCTVYNLIRLADHLFRWTGAPGYADYIERNLYNGILAQQHPETGMIAYFLPLEPGGRKIWGSPTCDFWCCHGTLVQAHTHHNAFVYYEDDDGLRVSQYIPTRLETKWNGTPISLQLDSDMRSVGAADDNSSAAGSRHRPTSWAFTFHVSCAQPVDFTLKLRIPWWVAATPTVEINGEPVQHEAAASSFLPIRRTWQQGDTVRLVLPKALTTCPLPDEPDTVAFMDGPIVLAGLCAEERRLRGDRDDPSTWLVPDNEREWGTWLNGYRARGQRHGLRFKPLLEITDEPYTVYFPLTGCRRS